MTSKKTPLAKGQRVRVAYRGVAEKAVIKDTASPPNRGGGEWVQVTMTSGRNEGKDKWYRPSNLTRF